MNKSYVWEQASGKNRTRRAIKDHQPAGSVDEETTAAGASMQQKITGEGLHLVAAPTVSASLYSGASVLQTYGQPDNWNWASWAAKKIQDTATGKRRGGELN